ncbi:MAG: FAD-dependent oxidoreductase [Acidimicrobiales bacterium]|nr:FAD-dependent oxidoreductase [Acidimicrobiales bacterium]MCB1260435.1 FAD-dependent oxidoreductase [Acidimicrobiales bacterium]
MPSRSPHETAPIAPLDAAEVTRWDAVADVVVVGLGCAGASAAVEASEAGADVVVLEAAAMGGGTSSMSGGLLYLGGGTAVQRACGFDDSVEDMAQFLVAACGPGVDEAKVDVYCSGSVAHFDWLVAHGVPFEARYHPEHDREPPDTSGLVYSGGEDAWPFTEIARPAPRGHHPAHADAAGGFLMQRLVAATHRAGARVMTDAPVTQLVVDGANVVTGVVATVDGERRHLRARRGVVLSAGGFVHNRAMVAQHCPAALRCNLPLGTPFDDGGGIRLGLGVGAAVRGMADVEVGIPFGPPRSVVRGIVVNGAGERFINEDTYAGRLGHAFLLDQDGRVFWVHDDETFAVNIAGYTPQWVAESPAELEAAIGLPDGALARTLDAYNAAAQVGEDPAWHKAAEHLVPLQPPYGVVDLGVERAYYATFTLGGLATTVDGEVIRPDGTPVVGLYAAGRTTAGIAAGGYVSGISLGDGTFFGRRAGRHAAARH